MTTARSSRRLGRLWCGAAIVTLSVAAAVAVAGCGSSNSDSSKPSDPVLAQGQAVYKKNCSVCHGTNGGGGAGPKLKGVVAERYTMDEHKDIISNGRSGGMPAFKDRLSPDDVEAVARYEREGL